MPSELILLGFPVFIFGTVIGSFLNVLILRLNTGMTLSGRSACFTCGKHLNWYELIPVLSFIGLRGKCCGCKSRISWQYPLVEALTGLIFSVVFFKIYFSLPTHTFHFALFTLHLFLIFSLLIVIAVYDYKHKIIPDGLVYTFAGLALLGSLFDFSLLSTFLAGPLLALPLFCFWFFSKGRWMGLGDAKLALGMGWFLGVAQGYTAFFLACVMGSIVGLSLISLQFLLGRSKSLQGLNFAGKNLTIKSEIPFGPFLILALAIVFLSEINFFDLNLLGL